MIQYDVFIKIGRGWHLAATFNGRYNENDAVQLADKLAELHPVRVNRNNQVIYSRTITAMAC